MGCSTADGPNALAVYDQVVNTAMTTYHLKVVGLISNESWNGSQADSTAKNAENNHGSGDNAYGQAFTRNAAGVLASHFAGRVAVWEVLNEPNAWTAGSPDPGVYEGSTFLSSSSLAIEALLYRDQGGRARRQTMVVSGHIGHDPGGASVTVSELGRRIADDDQAWHRRGTGRAHGRHGPRHVHQQRAQWGELPMVLAWVSKRLS